jgi:hypothetical protein
MKKFMLALLLAISRAPAVSYAQVVVRIGPPAPIVERRGPPPGAGYVWIGGYHRWDGGATSGFPAAGIARLTLVRVGLGTGGSIGVMGTCSTKGIGDS